MAATRANRYLALAGLGTRRSVEGLVRAGRVAVDGVVVQEPGAAVEPGATVTLDGAAVATEGQAGVLVALVEGDVPPLAHPSDLHLAGMSPDGRLAVLLSDERLARRLRALGYDAGRLGGLRPEAEPSGRSTRANRRGTRRRAPRSVRGHAAGAGAPDDEAPGHSR
jgi:hypothetical protein